MPEQNTPNHQQFEELQSEQEQAKQNLLSAHRDIKRIEASNPQAIAQTSASVGVEKSEVLLQSEAGLQYDSNSLSAVEILKKRIALASGKEQESLLKSLKQLTDIERQEKTDQHKRLMEKVEVARKTVLSVAGFSAGVYLSTHNFTYPGMFALGASLYTIAPGFVNRFIDKIKHWKD